MAEVFHLDLTRDQPAGAPQGWRAGCVTGVRLDRPDQEIPDDDAYQRAQANVIRVDVGTPRARG